MSADGSKEIELKLVTRSDVGPLDKTGGALDSVTKKADQATAAVNKTAQAIRSVPRIDPASTLARPPRASDFVSPERLRAQEAAAGRRTENSMAAEDRQREIESQRRNSFLESAQTRRAADAVAHDSSLLDGVSPTRLQTAGAIAGAAAAAGVAAKAFKELADQQNASQQLAAAMTSHGIASDDFYQRLHRTADELSGQTATKKAAWVEVLSQLVSAGGNEGNIDKLAEGVKHLAGLMGGNLSGASLAVEKAMQGSYQALERWGVIVPAVGSEAEKLDAVLKQLSERGAGLMEARSKSLAGQWTNLKNAGSSLLATFVGTFTHSEMLKDSMSGLTSIMKKAAEWIGGVVPPLEAMNSRLIISSRVLNEARDAARKTAQEFNSIAHQAERATQAMERQHQAAEAIRGAQDNIASAQRDLRQAQIDAAVHSGAITPQEGEIQTAALRLRYEQGRFQRNQQAQSDVQHAAEVRLNQLGTQRGLLQSEASDVQGRLQEYERAAQARRQANDDERLMRVAQHRLAEAQSRPTVEAALAASGEVPGIMGQAFSADEVSRRQRELNEITATATQSRARANQFNVSDEQGAALQERMARLTTALNDLSQVIQRETPGLQDSIGNARLNHDANSIIFSAVQQTLGTQLNDRLSQTPIQGGNIAQLRAALTAPDQEQLINALRTAIMLRNDAMTSGFTEIINALNSDIRTIQAQLRTIANRR